MGEHRTCCRFRYRFCGLYWARDTCGDEHESPTDESWTVGTRDQSTCQGEFLLVFLGSEGADSVFKILCAVSFVLSVALVALNGFRGFWYIYVFRFLILFSSIIPIRWAGKVIRAYNRLNSGQFTGQSGHGKDSLRTFNHEGQRDPRHDRTHQHFTRRTRPNRVSSQRQDRYIDPER